MTLHTAAFGISALAFALGQPVPNDLPANPWDSFVGNYAVTSCQCFQYGAVVQNDLCGINALDVVKLPTGEDNAVWQWATNQAEFPLQASRTEDETGVIEQTISGDANSAERIRTNDRTSGQTIGYHDRESFKITRIVDDLSFEVISDVWTDPAPDHPLACTFKLAIRADQQ